MILAVAVRQRWIGPNQKRGAATVESDRETWRAILAWHVTTTHIMSLDRRTYDSREPSSIVCMTETILPLLLTIFPSPSLAVGNRWGASNSVGRYCWRHVLREDAGTRPQRKTPLILSRGSSRKNWCHWMGYGPWCCQFSFRPTRSVGVWVPRASTCAMRVPELI